MLGGAGWAIFNQWKDRSSELNSRDRKCRLVPWIQSKFHPLCLRFIFSDTLIQNRWKSCQFFFPFAFFHIISAQLCWTQSSSSLSLFTLFKRGKGIIAYELHKICQMSNFALNRMRRASAKLRKTFQTGQLVLWMFSGHIRAGLARGEVWESGCATSGRGIVVQLLSSTCDGNTPFFLTSWPLQPTDIQARQIQRAD